ncbi:MAG: hypothetical protein IJD28_05710 [Deferribacterales bacterium]|nr:hypothetical protein [Deferribacterales bacterium]
MPNPNFDEQDDIDALQRKDTAHNLPVVWVILFVSLIVWGIYYYVSYTPSISGWTQAGALEETMQEK